MIIRSNTIRVKDIEPSAVIRLLTKRAAEATYEVASVDEENGRMTLTKKYPLNPVFTLPVTVSKSSDDETIIQVDVLDGTLFGRRNTLEKCIAFINDTIAARNMPSMVLGGNDMVFKHVVYRGGIPNIEAGMFKTHKLDIAIVNQGIAFFNPRKGIRGTGRWTHPVGMIPWEELASVVCSNEMSQTGQAFLTGGIARSGGTGIGGAIGTGIGAGIVAAFAQENPLVFLVQKKGSSGFAHEIAFDDHRNKKIRQQILQIRANLFPNGLPVQQAEQEPPKGDDVVTSIKKLGELRDQGLLTDDEFTAKKRELLDRL